MSTISASTTSTTGYVVTSDTTGTLVLQTGVTPTTAVTVASNQQVTFAQPANLPNTFGFKNRIINGAMVIDQRNAGAAVTPTLSGTFLVDRWQTQISQASRLQFQQNRGSVTPPAGFTNYLGAATASVASVGASDFFTIIQTVEGFNVADLGWGTANAQAVTLSFRVYSSLTGTFGGSIYNAAFNRSYPFTYTVSSANTWTTVSLTIPGDTSGTWVTNNGLGLGLCFSLGSGSTYSGTAGAWAGAGLFSATGAVSVVGTNGATFYITGVQLEKGSTATSFDYRPYGTELALCQRYYWKTYNQSAVPGSASSSATYRARSYSGSYAAAVVQFPVLMRAVPSCTLYNSNTGATNSWRDVDNNADRSASLSTILDNAVCTESSSVTVNTTNIFQIVASAEL